MKKLIVLFCLLLAVLSCKNKEKLTEVTTEDTKEIAYASFGMEIIADDALTSERMFEHYKTMRVGDTIDSKMTAKIKEVCSKKGCWMKVDAGNGEEVMVRFKDYGFFMPLNAKGDVVVNGKAFVTETSVEELRHYAEDAGKSKEDIEAITKSEKTYGFLADGVLLKQ